MSPIQIALLLLAVAGVWAIVELALTLRKTRTVVDSLDKTVNDLNNTIAEAQPVVAKLDGAVDELTPALAQMEPLLKSSKTAVDALTSNLVESKPWFATFLRSPVAWPRPAMLCRA